MNNIIVMKCSRKSRICVVFECKKRKRKRCRLWKTPGWFQTQRDMSLIVYKQKTKNMDTQLSVQQDRDGPTPTVFGPLTSMLVPQDEKPVASFMKRFLISLFS